MEVLYQAKKLELPSACLQNVKEFQKDFHEAKKEIQRTGELTLNDSINQHEIINMVSEGIQQAIKNPPHEILEEYKVEIANAVQQNTQLQQQLKEIQQPMVKLQEKLEQAKQPSQQQMTYMHQE
eukprot:15354767-Ditylum_brightwellii.AAC.1